MVRQFDSKRRAQIISLGCKKKNSPKSSSTITGVVVRPGMRKKFFIFFLLLSRDRSFTSSFSTEKCLEYQVSLTQEDDCWFLFLNRGGNSSRKDSDISQLSAALMDTGGGKDAKMAEFRLKEECFKPKMGKRKNILVPKRLESNNN
ncbi:hypothetical protein TNCT_217371 [Trichonephila clavata]|uniref:Uncharacterized protein n=1 Tax=Trichonephila clavata TaxID=2740835 RepID=A0A8X6FDC6_TRICU|nr:hypothetical protein TNCT_217371 [Trichonephila clavata]